MKTIQNSASPDRAVIKTRKTTISREALERSQSFTHEVTNKKSHLTQQREDFIKFRSLNGEIIGEAILPKDDRNHANLIWLSVSFPSLLYGQNGICLKSDREIHLSLTVLLNAMRPLIEGDWLNLIPGYNGHLCDLESEETSRWSSIEIAYQFKDDNNNHLYNATAIKFPFIRNKPLHIKHEGLRYNGTNVQFQVYNKSLQTRRKFKLRKEKSHTSNATRFEFKLQKEGIQRYLSQRDDGAALLTFGIEDLHSSFISLLDNSSGYFAASGTAKTNAGKWPNAMALAMKERHIELPEIIKILERSNQWKKSSISRFRRELTTASSLLSTLDICRFLEGDSEPLDVVVAGIHPLFPTPEEPDPRISRIYTSVKCQGDNGLSDDWCSEAY